MQIMYGSRTNCFLTGLLSISYLATFNFATVDYFLTDKIVYCWNT